MSFRAAIIELLAGSFNDLAVMARGSLELEGMRRRGDEVELVANLMFTGMLGTAGSAVRERPRSGSGAVVV